MFDPDDFSTAFDLLESEPEEDPPAEGGDTGPWVSHGTIHLGHRPINH